MSRLPILSNRFSRKRVIYVGRDYLLATCGYSFYKKDSKNGRWTKYATVHDPLNSVLSTTSISRRFTRAEITKYYLLEDGTELCIARKGIFRKSPDESEFRKVFNVIRGSRPMNICEDKDGGLFFGEYFANMEKLAVHIYSSLDKGKTWHVVYTFPEGNINHVHGIFWDPYTQNMWFATGDRDNECIIGYTEDGFKTVKEVFRGGQEYRTCFLFFYKDFIVYGTDSQYQKNVLRKLNRNDFEISDLQVVPGPVIRGTQLGNIAMISTDVEPSDVNNTRNAYVWYTRDGLHWAELYHAEKDFLNPTLFQFGVFDLPHYSHHNKGDQIFITGKAVRGCSGDTLVFDDK